jgi:hypothetical protein
MLGRLVVVGLAVDAISVAISERLVAGVDLAFTVLALGRGVLDVADDAAAAAVVDVRVGVGLAAVRVTAVLRVRVAVLVTFVARVDLADTLGALRLAVRDHAR